MKLSILLNDIADQLVGEWHMSVEFGDLYEHMQMSIEEYAKWVEKNEYPQNWLARFSEGWLNNYRSEKRLILEQLEEEWPR